MNIFNPVCLSIYKSYVSSAVRGIYLLYYKGLFRMLLYLSHLRVPEAGQGKDTQAWLLSSKQTCKKNERKINSKGQVST